MGAVLVLCASAALVGRLIAQAPVRLFQETPFLKEPRGLRLITLVPGVRVTPRKSSNDHIEVTIQGWLWTASTQPDRREGFDLSVKVPAGENVRAAPDGPVIGRAVDGALFTRVGTRGGWSQVRRTGWIARPAAAPPVRIAARPAPAPAPVSPPARDSTTSGATPPRAADTAPAERRGSLRRGIALQKAPEGPAVATLSEAAEVEVTGQDRDWVKVRIEGWVRAADVNDRVQPRPAITAQMLRDSPDKYVGQMVDWRLQFLARQKADELRPEMPLGHAYLLARGPLPETGFVYLLVSKEQADRLQGLKPLDELAVMVTVRAARTRYLATPVVELVRLGGAESRTP